MKLRRDREAGGRAESKEGGMGKTCSYAQAWTQAHRETRTREEAHAQVGRGDRKRQRKRQSV